MGNHLIKRSMLTVSVALLVGSSGLSHATNGYFAHGFGTKAKGMGGVGMAISQDAFAPATNPAGIAGMESRIDGALAYFRPERSYEVFGPGLEPTDFETIAENLDITEENLEEGLAAAANELGVSVEELEDALSGDDDGGLLDDPGALLDASTLEEIADDLDESPDRVAAAMDALFLSLVEETLVPLNTNNQKIESRERNFFIPSFGFVRQIDERSSWGVTVVGNGGLNTNYPGFENNEGCSGPAGSPIGTQTGPFCEGAAGVDLMQLMVLPTFATSFGEQGQWRFGFSPVISYQRFEAYGLGQFEQFSESPDHVSDNGYDDSWGYGVRLGMQTDIGDWASVGASYQSRQRHGGFDDYRGLFAEQGSFDIPSTWGVGAAIYITPRLTVAADYSQINYSEVDSVGNSVTRLTEDGERLGSSRGPGFGWDDIDIYKVGVQYETRGNWTFRAGYNYGQNPVSADEVTLNILAPGVIKEHYTVGATRQIGDRMELSFSAMYAPKESVRGEHAFFDQQDVEIEMSQYEIEVGIGYRF
ncbi:OmpP1/FadL family transporter [Thioalkalivibrio sp. ALE28]|uniref:OmpP1/FadL family transporter n=1 Tax=Thioalkalivibrio sp. ALE28 TaxID=1158179 RepID=UPI00039B8FCA|nr:outer membrane protein transport protein [Thioalkalivibrio sp. ALE28]